MEHLRVEERNEALSEIARQFTDYLEGQTGILVTQPEPGNHDSLRDSFERLDLALAQIADLASVYGADARADIEPLTVPTAALAGELLRSGIGGHWMEPAYEGDPTLMLVTAGGIALDLDGMARSALLSRQPSLSPLIEKLIPN